MQLIDAPQTDELLPYGPLISALQDGFALTTGEITAPERLHYDIDAASSSTRTLLFMPAWAEDAGVVVKLVNVVPDNNLVNLPAIQAQVLVSDPKTGNWQAIIDGSTLTAKRTAAASALAASYLAMPMPETLLIMGTGRLARELAAAHCTVRPSIKKVLIWGRNFQKAINVAATIPMAIAVEDAQQACRNAQIISCCTFSDQPLVQGDWVEEGSHIDLVGAFRADLRESDGALVQKSRVFVDTYAGANQEAGDLLQAEAEGYFSMGAIEADLHELGQTQFSRKSSDITLFKSVGAAIEDFVAARLVLEHLQQH